MPTLTPIEGVPMGLIDIIVIGLVVAVIVTRFTKFKLPKDPRDTAARRTDFDRLRGKPLIREDAPRDVTAEAQASRVDDTARPRKPSAKELQAAAKNLTGMAKVKALDPAFNEADFVDGAKAAYGYFNSCWNAKDEEGLANLCAPALFDRLRLQLQDDRLWEETHVDAITDAAIVEARVHGKTAVIDVMFETLEREGSSAARAVKRLWVLARPLGSDDPNWELQDIKTTVDA
ncbi:MAG: hypothetical protein EON60_03580 [Alphaproteobacteria bacterium]|nr:MAG: hypothetical protein EON60_03580 [Alphaproteobacteria bacterium]